MGRRLLSPKEARWRLGDISRSEFYKKYIDTGRLRFVYLGPKTLRLPEDEVDTLIDEVIAERDANLDARFRTSFEKRDAGPDRVAIKQGPRDV
jgi:predicted site-specific integrase-resolvase